MSHGMAIRYASVGEFPVRLHEAGWHGGLQPPRNRYHHVDPRPTTEDAWGIGGVLYVNAGMVPDPVPDPGIPVAGKRSRTGSGERFRLHEAPYIDMQGLPMVLTVDLDSSSSVRDGVDALASAGSIPYPSVISVNDRKGTSQMHWLLDWDHADRVPVAPGERLEHAKWRLYREMMRSLTVLMDGDPLFQGRRMRNPWYKPPLGSGVRVLSLDGMAPWYDPAALGEAVRGAGVWIPDSKVFARSRMRSCIVRDAVREHAPAGNEGRTFTVADFISGVPLPIGCRNSRAYRRLYAAAMHGVDPGEVMAGLRFEGSFPRAERSMIVRHVRRAAGLRGMRGVEPAEGVEPPHAGSLWRSLQATRRRRRRRGPMSACISDVARRMAAKGRSHVSREGREAQRKALGIGVRRMCIRRMRCRGDVIDAYMTAADDVIMTDRMVSRHLLRLHGRAACVGEALPEPTMRTVRTVRRELVSWALQTIRVRADRLSPEFRRALSDPDVRDRPGVWPALVIRAAVSVGFLDLLHAAGLAMLPGDVDAPAVMPRADEADAAFSKALGADASDHAPADPAEDTDAGDDASHDEPVSAEDGVDSDNATPFSYRRGGFRHPPRALRSHRIPAIGVAASGVLGGSDPMMLFSAAPRLRPQRFSGSCAMMGVTAGERDTSHT